jgi:hypothetical protein
MLLVCLQYGRCAAAYLLPILFMGYADQVLRETKAALV